LITTINKVGETETETELIGGVSFLFEGRSIIAHEGERKKGERK